MTALTERIPRRGRSARELAEQLQVSPQTIRKWTAEPRQVYLERTRIRRDRIRQLRATGMSFRAIAAELDCSLGTVHNALQSAKAS